MQPLIPRPIPLLAFILGILTLGIFAHWYRVHASTIGKPAIRATSSL